MGTTEPDIQSSLADMAVRIAAWGDARGVAIDPAELEKMRTGEMDAVEVMAIMTKIGMIFDQRPAARRRDRPQAARRVRGQYGCAAGGAGRAETTTPGREASGQQGRGPGAGRRGDGSPASRGGATSRASQEPSTRGDGGRIALVLPGERYRAQTAADRRAAPDITNSLTRPF